MAEVLVRDRGAAAFMELHHAVRAVLRKVELDLLVHNVSVPQADVLAALGAGEPLTFGELAQRLGLASQSLTGVVDRLEEKAGGALVQRRRDGHDRRKIWVELTEKGRALAGSLVPAFDRAVATRLSTVSVAELRHLCRRVAWSTEYADKAG